jgi:hypothetical protein
VTSHEPHRAGLAPEGSRTVPAISPPCWAQTRSPRPSPAVPPTIWTAVRATCASPILLSSPWGGDCPRLVSAICERLYRTAMVIVHTIFAYQSGAVKTGGCPSMSVLKFDRPPLRIRGWCAALVVFFPADCRRTATVPSSTASSELPHRHFEGTFGDDKAQRIAPCAGPDNQQRARRIGSGHISRLSRSVLTSSVDEHVNGGRQATVA